MKMVNFDDDDVVDDSGWGWCKTCFQFAQKRTWAPLVNFRCSDCQQKQKQSSNVSNVSIASNVSISTSVSQTGEKTDEIIQSISEQENHKILEIVDKRRITWKRRCLDCEKNLQELQTECVKQSYSH